MGLLTFLAGGTVMPCGRREHMHPAGRCDGCTQALLAAHPERRGVEVTYR